MTGSLGLSLGCAAFAGAAVAAGAGLTAGRALAPRVRSLVQHAAAGTVLAGLVVDVLAKLLVRSDQVTAAAAGMAAGLAGVLALRRRSGNGGLGPLVTTAAADAVVDGAIVGLSAALGAGTGVLFVLALAPEMGLLGVTVSQELLGRWRSPQVVAFAAVVGTTVTGAGGLGSLTAQGPAWVGTSVLGAGASVILYFVMEELLREAHETTAGTAEVAVLFACFLPVFLAGVAVG